MISQIKHKIKKTEQFGKYGKGNMQITKTPELNKMRAMKNRWWKSTYMLEMKMSE